MAGLAPRGIIGQAKGRAKARPFVLVTLSP
jgi:hypothetical protein